MRMAVVLPALFLMIAGPLAVFVAGGAGTHMSPLLLYPFATPWWLVLPVEGGADAEFHALVIGCGLNTGILAVVGMLLDRRRQRRAS